MNILKKASLSQVFFYATGLISVSFIALLPDKQWWHWFLIFVVLATVITDVREVFIRSRETHPAEQPSDIQQISAIAVQHQSMRQSILQQIDVAKAFMHRYTAHGFSDGHSLRFVDTHTVVLCTITLESSISFDPITEERRSYDMERTYCITKNTAFPVRTVTDAVIIHSVDGATHVETWVPIDSIEWMYADEHVASTLELDELLGYLRCISGVQ